MYPDVLELFRQGRFMAEHGGCPRMAFTVAQALELVDVLERSGEAILGGDIYEIIDECFEPTSMSWHSDQKVGEAQVEFSKRSAKETREYLAQFNGTECLSYHIDLVFREEREYLDFVSK